MKIRDKFACILLDTWSWRIEGPGVGEVRGLIPRSGVDSAWRGMPGKPRPVLSMEPTSDPPSLRTRRPMRGGERRSRSPISWLDGGDDKSDSGPQFNQFY